MSIQRDSYHLCAGADEARYVEGTEEYRRDSLDFVQAEGIQLHRYDLSKESVSTLSPGS